MLHAPVVLAARILVVDDNESDVFLLDRALKKQDFPFELVHLLSGGEALAFIHQAGRLRGCGQPKPDPAGSEPLPIYWRRHRARNPKRPPSCGGSGVRVEFFAVPARRDATQGSGGFPVHPQAYGTGSVHGDRQDPQGSAERPPRPADGADSGRAARRAIIRVAPARAS